MSSSDRMLAILGVFSLDRPKLTVEELACATGGTVSTTYRHLRSLGKAGLVAAAPPRHYALGPAIIGHERLMRMRDPLISSARRPMRHVAQEVGLQAVVLLCRLYERKVICIHQESVAPEEFFQRFGRDQTMNYERGQPMDLHRGAPSKAILAHMKTRNVQPIYREEVAEWEAAGLGRDWTEVRRSLRQMRNDVVVTSRGELAGRLQGIAVPILAAQLGVIGSLAVVIQPDRPIVVGGQVDSLLLDAAREIEANFSLEPTKY